MTAIIIISLACAVALMLLILALRLFDNLPIDEDSPKARHRNQYAVLAALAVVCLLVAWMAIKQDSHVNDSAESKRQTELKQRQLQHEIDGLKERTAALVKGSTWVVSPKGLIEYEERVSR